MNHLSKTLLAAAIARVCLIRTAIVKKPFFKPFKLQLGMLITNLSRFNLSSEIDKSITKVAWTKSHDEMLIKLRETFKYSTWVEIASHIPGKNAKQCSYRYNKLVSKNQENQIWSREEDFRLMEMVEYLGENFEAIKSYFPSKTTKEIKHRYYKKLCPKLINFSTEEDSWLLCLYNGGELSDQRFNQLSVKGILSIKRRLELLLKLKGSSLQNVSSIMKLFMSKQKYQDDTNWLDSENTEKEISVSKVATNTYDSTTASNALSDIYEHKSAISRDGSRLFDDPHFITNDINVLNSSLKDYSFDMNFTDISSAMLNGYNIFEENKDTFFDKCDDSYSNIFFGQNGNYNNLDSLEKEEIVKSQISLLLEKKSCLETILSRIQQISEGFFKNLEQKIEASVLDNTSKIECLDSLAAAIKYERQLIQKLAALDSTSQDENQMIKDLLSTIEILINLISVTKDKVRIVRRLSET